MQQVTTFIYNCTCDNVHAYHVHHSLEAFCAQTCYVSLIKTQTQELKCFSLDARGKIILSICKLSFKYYLPL